MSISIQVTISEVYNKSGMLLDSRAQITEAFGQVHVTSHNVSS